MKIKGAITRKTNSAYGEVQDFLFETSHVFLYSNRSSLFYHNTVDEKKFFYRNYALL